MRVCEYTVHARTHARTHARMHSHTTHPLFRPTSCQKDGEVVVEISACEDTEGETVVSVALVLMAMLEVTLSDCCKARCDPEQG